ncbi:IQ calmodulin-binding domain-containing family protein [Microdochium trichocladiopsis]|uniref:IQ calmodulin-binding domain-containing family protein n=1 Tax=Microdochium trichocladiopsis TaxID=1682393 RepID=A0A9P9BWJ7_9PEZI|nr:IQ calmodulin-binding domain-containing family protein [Microdochium trichocladiopsis]KAH7040665.1 IQ calmodulin-binding domain-containing family protein [Microdochium trichocladiopsis]
MRRASADLSDPARNLEESVGSPDPGAIDTTMDDLATEVVDEHNPRVYTPPPHIAARFYRPSQIRRKDSAASSRRNSISSSRSSINFAQEDGPQSKYIAQQLRRASILEDRKARLADRAAHAEKVRLRAAMAKASSQKSSNSEERALAAAQAREKNLAEIVASCAEEVRRAKSRAEAIKDLREQQLHQLRQQMEQRLAEAEKRRENLRKSQAARRSRGQSLGAKKPSLEVLPDVKEQDAAPLSENTAVSRIQWWWRATRRQKVVHDFAKLGLSIDSVRDTSFEAVVELLAQEDVLVTTASILRLCGLREGDTGSVEDMAAVRTFLSAFMILGHPNQVLNNNDGEEQKKRAQNSSAQGQYIPRNDSANPQLQDLVGKARDLLITFENILSRLTTLNGYTPPPALREALPEAYATFHNAFIAWKARDSDALIEIMLMQFVELDAILESVKGMTEEAVTAAYRESIQDNQIKLMVRIKKLAGPQRGKKLVFEAVQKARKARAAKKTAGDRRPRIAEAPDSDNIMEPQASAADVVSSQLRTLTPPPTPPSSRVLKQAIDHPAYPPILPENRIIVHELAINREYRIEYEYFQEQHKLRMDPLLKDLRASENDKEKEFRYLLIMTHYIKDRLQHLVRPGNSMHTFIGEILDADVAQRQFRAGSFSYEKFFASMGSLLPKLCAPVRDEQVKDFVDNKMRNGHVVDRLEALIAIIDIMLYDYANYMLQVATPKLAEHASSYEAKRFAEDLESGQVTLETAKASWRAAHDKVHAEAARRDPEGVSHPRSRPTSDKIYWQMLLDEFTQPSATVESVPAPFALDVKRRSRLGLQTLRVATAGAILLQCKNILKRDVRAPWKGEAGRIFVVLEAMTDDSKSLSVSAAVDGIMAALEAGRSMPAATKAHLRALVLKILTASLDAKKENAEPREPVLKLLLTRVRNHMLARLQASSASEKVKATGTAGEKLAGLGLPEFVEKVREVVDEMSRVGTVDREAHGSIWESIASDLAAGRDLATSEVA